MNSFDLSIIRFFNSFAGRFIVLDAVMVFLVGDYLLRGGFAIALFWSLWAQDDSKRSEKREFLVFGLLAAICAVMTARLLAAGLPFRVRPLHNPMIPFRLPFTMDSSTLAAWSSFPSDTATLFFCLAVILWMVSRRVGIVAMCHAFLIVSIPRIYVGIHYPSDILAGALLGGGFASLAMFAALRKAVTAPILSALDACPSFFYACLFLVTFEFAIVFETFFGFLQSFHGVIRWIRLMRWIA